MPKHREKALGVTGQHTSACGNWKQAIRSGWFSFGKGKSVLRRYDMDNSWSLWFVLDTQHAFQKEVTQQLMCQIIMCHSEKDNCTQC